PDGHSVLLRPGDAGTRGVPQVAGDGQPAHPDRGHRPDRAVPRHRGLVDHRPDDLRQRRVHHSLSRADRPAEAPVPTPIAQPTGNENQEQQCQNCRSRPSSPTSSTSSTPTTRRASSTPSPRTASSTTGGGNSPDVRPSRPGATRNSSGPPGSSRPKRSRLRATGSPSSVTGHRTM